MTFRVERTTDWPMSRLAPYGPAITAAMNKLAEKFPADLTTQSLHAEILTGNRELWLILDEEGQFVSFCLTHIQTVEATGCKIVTLTSHAGAEGLSCVPEMCRVIEEYAWSIGADYTAAEGRRGWSRELAKHDYREYAVVFRKARPVEAA